MLDSRQKAEAFYMRILLLVTLLLCSEMSFAQIVDTEHTSEGWTNGRAWNELDLQSRITYVTGIYNGISLVVQRALAESSPEAKSIATNTTDDLILAGFRM